MKLPIEIKQEIILYIEFNKVVKLFPRIAKYIYNKEIHTWNWAVENGHVDVIKWLHINNKEGY